MSITTSTPLPTSVPLVFETWMGSAMSFTKEWAFPMCNFVTQLDYTTYSIWPEITTSAITRDKTDTWAKYEIRLTLYENSLSSQRCMPSPWSSYGTGFYYYPGACPTDWTSWTTLTAVTERPRDEYFIGDENRSRSTWTRVVTYTDAICCPESFTAVIDTGVFGTGSVCYRSLTSGSRYSIATWHYTSWTTLDGADKGSRRRSSSYVSPDHLETVVRDTVLTFQPISVRFEHDNYLHVPTKAGFYTSTIPEPTSTYNPFDDPHEQNARFERRRKLLLSLCIPLGILFFTIIGGIIACVRHRKTKARAKRAQRDAEIVERAVAAVQKGGTTAAVTETTSTSTSTPLYSAPTLMVSERRDRNTIYTRPTTSPQELKEEISLVEDERRLAERREELRREEEALRARRASRTAIF